MGEQSVGTVSHFWSALGVAGIELSGDLKVGDTIHIYGHSSDFSQTVDSIQIEHLSVDLAKAGDSIGLKVNGQVRVHDQVRVVTPD